MEAKTTQICKEPSELLLGGPHGLILIWTPPATPWVDPRYEVEDGTVFVMGHEIANGHFRQAPFLRSRRHRTTGLHWSEEHGSKLQRFAPQRPAG